MQTLDILAIVCPSNKVYQQISAAQLLADKYLHTVCRLNSLSDRERLCVFVRSLNSQVTCRIDELEAELASSDRSAKPVKTSTDSSAAQGAAEVGEHSSRQELIQRLKEVEAREQAVYELEENLKAGKQKEVKDKEAKDKEAKEQQALYSKVSTFMALM